MRIGISGTNGTGKSTTIVKLIGSMPGVAVDMVRLNEIVASCPYPTGQEQTVEASVWVTNQIKSILDKPTSILQVFDRTPLDVMAFTQYINYRDQSDKSEKLIQEIESQLNRLDIVYFVRPSSKWLDRNCVAPIEASFSLLIDHFTTISVSDVGREIIELPEDVERRIEIIRADIGVNS